MGLINWIFDIYQHTQIDQAKSDAATVRAELASLRAQGGGLDARRLEDALGELAPATKTLQRVLVEKGVCSASELTQTLQRVDQEDGRADGKSPIS